jgi:hypothetical protein
LPNHSSVQPARPAGEEAGDFTVHPVGLACWQKFRLKSKVGSSQLPELDPDDLRYVRHSLSPSLSLTFLSIVFWVGGLW